MQKPPRQYLNKESARNNPERLILLFNLFHSKNVSRVGTRIQLHVVP